MRAPGTRSFQRGALSDEDLLDMDAQGKAGGTTRWFGRFFVILALTFAAAYYVPLYRTHKTLLTEYGSLGERVTAIEKDLARARTDLGVVTAKNTELMTRHQAQDTNREERTSRLLRLQTDLSSKLALLIEKRDLSVGMKADRLALTLPSGLTEVHDRTEVTPSAQVTLCNVATAISTGPFGITVVSQNDGESKGAHSAWEAASARAATAARVLEQKCHYPTNRIATMSRPGTEAARIDVEIASLER
jgi:flagellar motor protein MotB